MIEVYLCDPTGVRLECLDYLTSIEYVLSVNAPGIASVLLPADFDRSKIRLDNIIEIWRGEIGALKLDFCGMLRLWAFGDADGVDYTELHAVGLNDLLARRIVEDYAGSAQALMTDQTDDMIKAIATDQLGGDADAARDLTSVGGGFTVSANLADGQEITKAFAYRNVLELYQELAGISAQAGTRVYFDIVPVVASTVTGALAFRLDTFTDWRGVDRTDDSTHPAFVGREWGNLHNSRMEFDYTQEVNHCLVLGQGEGESREVLWVTDTARAGASIWNRREGTKNATHVDYGDTAALTAEGNAYLDEHKPAFRFSGEVIETPKFRYGINWGLGDLVTVVMGNVQKDALISLVYIRRDSSGESATAKLELME